jgi:hypothetical protein
MRLSFKTAGDGHKGLSFHKMTRWTSQCQLLFRRDRTSESSHSRSTKSLTGKFNALASAMIVSNVELLRPEGVAQALGHFPQLAALEKEEL